MTPELTYLAYVAALTAVLWIPYIGGQLILNGMLTPGDYADPNPRPAPMWVRRANRAHLNAVESLAPFAALILTAHVAGVGTPTTAMWAMVYFWARVAHAVIYISGIPYLRTLVFAVGLVATLGIFWDVIQAAPGV